MKCPICGNLLIPNKPMYFDDKDCLRDDLVKFYICDKCDEDYYNIADLETIPTDH